MLLQRVQITKRYVTTKGANNQKVSYVRVQITKRLVMLLQRVQITKRYKG